MLRHQKREDFVKRSFDVFYDYYSREPYREQIDAMGKLGISSAVLDIVLNPETYVNIPTGDGTSTEMLFDDHSNKIGVFVVDPGEEVELTVGFHPLQNADASGPATSSFSLSSGAGASIYNPVTKRTSDTSPDALYLYRRPTLILPYEDSRSHEFSTVLVHELTHVAQQLMDSVRTFENSETGELDRIVSDYNNEFDAYQMQEDTFYNDMLTFLSDETMGMAHTVTSHRKHRLRTTGGYVNRGNLDEIRRHSTVGRTVSRAFISSK